MRAAGVRTIVSFELRYNPWLRFIRWMRESGRLGRIHFARTNYLSRVTDWYSGWEWCRTVKGGGSHLLAAGCHAVDALRWATGLEIAEVSAYHMQGHAGLRMADDDRRQRPLRGRRARTRDEHDRLPDAVHASASR